MIKQEMAVLGHPRRLSNVRVRSAFPLIATIERTSPFGRKVPLTDFANPLGAMIGQCTLPCAI